MKHEALTVTAQALAITSQLLAIGIEVGIIAGGIYFYKKVIQEPKETFSSTTSPCIVLTESIPKKSWKEKFQKTKPTPKSRLYFTIY